MRVILVALSIFVFSGAFSTAMAQEAGTDSAPKKQNSNSEEVKDLEQRLEDQQKQIDELKAQIRTSSETPDMAQTPPPARAVGGAIASMNPKISLDGLFAAAASTAQDLENVETGGHDPNQRGITVQNVELTLGAAVDPYFTGNANIVYQIDEQGESTVELEEAYRRISREREFKEELAWYLKDYVGRPTPLYFARHVPEIRELSQK